MSRRSDLSWFSFGRWSIRPTNHSSTARLELCIIQRCQIFVPRCKWLVYRLEGAE